MKLLLAEDDCELARRIETDLGAAGHDVIAVKDGAAALEHALAMRWDVIVLDVTLPGKTGFQIVAAIRASGLNTPVILLTALANVSDRVHGLSVGADDYLTKPFAMDELLARVLALKRRHSGGLVEKAITPADWKLDPARRTVTIGGRMVELQPREWSLLEVLMGSQGDILTKTHLLERVWGLHFDPGTNVVDAVVCRLRRKLDLDQGTCSIQTVRGRGYMFKNDVHD